MAKAEIKKKNGKIRLQVIIECDWLDYEDVAPELILEDAVAHLEVKEGVRIFLDPAVYGED